MRKIALRLIFAALLGLGGALAGSYTVQPGDTAYSIAARFGISPEELLRRNKLVSPALRVGQVLDVPDNLRHTVARGETLYSIARRYNANLSAIRQANKLTTDAVRVGQVLLIPISTGSSATNAPATTPTPAGSSTANTGTVTVKPSPPPLPNLGPSNAPGSTPGSASSNPGGSKPPAPTTTPNSPSPPSSVNPSTINGANLPTSSPNLTPPDALPRTTLTIPAPDPSNPFGAAKGQPIGPVPFRTATSAPVPDLGTPPSSPAGNPETPANTTTSTIGPTAPSGSSATPPGSSTPSSGDASPATTDPTSTNPPETPPLGVVSEDPEILHSVASGDTLFSIARRYGVTVNAIKLSNNLGSDALRVGQVLNIPVLTRAVPASAPISTPPILNPSMPPSATSSLREVSERYLGVTYRYGGSSADGLDCSGFVVIVFSELGIKLPRTSAQQFQYGQPIERADLRLGDLVFFNTSGQGVSHVGIYLSDGEFIHAASNPGKVIRSRLEERYYAQRYLGARRVITDD